MDFFDPQKQKQHHIRLAIGYVIIGLVLILATTILLYRAYGFGVDENGRIIQNGLVFVSSHPEGADVFVNGKRYKDRSNTRLDVPSGQYLLELKKGGYDTWKRALTVEGGKVQRFDYPMLFPSHLTTTVVKQYETTPGISTQSIDRRWLLVGLSDQSVFDLYDLDEDKPTAKQLTISADILAAGTTTKGWELVEWAKDNRHILLRRAYDKTGTVGHEYILFDRERPDLSQNLSIVLGFTPATIELRKQAYDQYYLFDPSSGQVFTATLDRPTPQPYLANVLAFTSEGDTVLYATNQDASAGKTLIRAKVKDDPPLLIRQVPANTAYVLDMGVYNDDLYVAAGVQSEDRVYLYQEPIATLKRKPKEPLVPLQIMKVSSPNHLSFSVNKRFVIAENADRFAVYDIETDRGYTYQVDAPMDAPQTYARWIDGFRLGYVSNGILAVFDFDGINLHRLSAANPALMAGFDRDYRFVYTLNAQNALTSTALLTGEDL